MNTSDRPVLTLHQGDTQASYVEHPMEVARKALLAAAEIEDDEWRPLLVDAARALPDRSPLAIAASADDDGYGPTGSAIRGYNLQVAWREEWQHAEVAKREWKALAPAQQAQMVLSVLGDDVLTGAEIVHRLNESVGRKAGMKMMGGGAAGPIGIVEVRNIGAQLANSGRLHRELDNRRHFRYSRTAT